MNKILTIAQRELLETVKTRAFFFGVIFMPGLILAFVFGAEKLGKFAQEDVPPRKLAVVDEHGQVYDRLADELRQYNEKNPGQQIVPQREPAPADSSALAERVRSGEIYGYLIIPAAAVTANGSPTLGRKDGQIVALKTIDHAVSTAVELTRFATNDPPIDPKLVQWLTRPTRLEETSITTGKAGANDTMARVLTPFAFMFLLYFGTFGISMGLLTSLIEEKSSRVVEMLLAAVSPTQLLAGKILGMVGVGVIVLGSWLGVGYFTARSYNVVEVLAGERLLYVILYFIPGFLFMSALLAGIGAACNTLKEAQSMASPLNIINIVPMVLWFPLSQSPNSLLSVALSFIPPITPFVMILRICADPNIPLWQVIATQAVLWASVGVLIWAAGRIFRIGVLMYGKPPTLRELLHWVRFA
ncbi:MAG: ABC transporter permease [Phycisphaerae bacterium]